MILVGAILIFAGVSHRKSISFSQNVCDDVRMKRSLSFVMFASIFALVGCSGAIGSSGSPDAEDTPEASEVSELTGELYSDDESTAC